MTLEDKRVIMKIQILVMIKNDEENAFLAQFIENNGANIYLGIEQTVNNFK